MEVNEKVIRLLGERDKYSCKIGDNKSHFLGRFSGLEKSVEILQEIFKLLDNDSKLYTLYNNLYESRVSGDQEIINDLTNKIYLYDGT